MPISQVGAFIEGTLRYLESLAFALIRLFWSALSGGLTRTILYLRMRYRGSGGAFPSPAVLLFVACLWFALSSPTRALLTLSTAQPNAPNQLASLTFGNGDLDRSLLVEAIILFFAIDLTARAVSGRKSIARSRRVGNLHADRLILTAQILVTTALLTITLTTGILWEHYGQLALIALFTIPMAICAPVWRIFRDGRGKPSAWLLSTCFQALLVLVSSASVATVRTFAPSPRVVDLRCEWQEVTKTIDFTVSLFNPTQRILMPDVENWRPVLTVSSGEEQEDLTVEWGELTAGARDDPVFLRPGDVAVVRRSAVLTGTRWQGVRLDACRVPPPPWLEVALTDMRDTVFEVKGPAGQPK